MAHSGRLRRRGRGARAASSLNVRCDIRAALSFCAVELYDEFVVRRWISAANFQGGPIGGTQNRISTPLSRSGSPLATCAQSNAPRHSRVRPAPHAFLAADTALTIVRFLMVCHATGPCRWATRTSQSDIVRSSCSSRSPPHAARSMPSSFGFERARFGGMCVSRRARAMSFTAEKVECRYA